MNSKVHFDFSIPTNPEEISLSETHKKLKKKTKKLCNFANEAQSEFINYPAIACDVNDRSSLFKEKCKLIEVMKNDTLITDDDIPQSDVELYINLYASLVNDNTRHIQLLEYKKKELEEEKKILAELKESLSLIKTNMDILMSSQNNNPDILDLKLLKTKYTRKFQQVRKNLHFILETSFGDSFKDIIKELTEAYFKGGDDRYIEVTDELPYPYIAILKDASLIIQDPYNTTRIKFDDIV